METLTLRRVHEYADVANGWPVVSVSVGHDETTLIVCREQPWRSREREALTSGNAVRSVLYVLDGTECQVIGLPPSTGSYGLPQPFGDGRWLVSLVAPDRRDLLVLDGEGVIGALEAGDIPNHVETTHDAKVWLGYGDESVYGGSDLGAQGVVRLEADGTVAFRLLDHLHRLDAEATFTDCYALNVVSDAEVWVYYINEGFNVARIVGDNVFGWWKNIPVPTATAMAVADDLIGLCTWNSGNVSVHVGRVNEGRFRRLEAVDANGMRGPFTYAFGRGSRLYITSDAALYVVDIQDLDG